LAFLEIILAEVEWGNGSIISDSRMSSTFQQIILEWNYLINEFMAIIFFQQLRNALVNFDLYY